MALKKLTKENMDELMGKRICLFEKSVSYLEELCNRYDVLAAIAYIVDTNERNLGSFVFRGKMLEVCGLSWLTQIDFHQTVIVIISDYYKEAYEKIMDVLEIVNPDTDVFYFANRETEYEESYRAHYKNEPLEDLIIFRSGPHASSYIKEMDFADNARALFEYALQTGLNHQYELMWFVKNPEEFDQYRNMENVSFLSFDWSVSDNQEERDAYYHALCLAKYIFFTDAYGFARNCRSDQIRVQLWHGCGFKTRVNFVRCEKRYEYTTVISELYSKIHQDIYGLREDQMLVTGYAKQDWLFSGLEDEKWDWLQIPKDNKCIFWLPTFRTATKSLKILNERQIRSETGLPIVDTMDKLVKLNKLLEQRKLMLLIKLHPFQDKSTVTCENLPHIILLDNHELFARDIQINQLLSRADALISDYSSAAVDYMLLNRPIAFTLDDVEEYASSRGFVFDPIQDWLPGGAIYTFEQFCIFLEEVAAGKDSTRNKRRMLTDKMHKYHDGNSCKRILEALKV